ncbi:MAG: hypothetical protein M3N37_03995 [Actinomycetota bacterium]|nr:hypothetical protein [Actinomycetota bacterium]
MSRALGYVENGDRVHDRDGVCVRQVGLKLARSRWEERRRCNIEIRGLDGCLDWFGA